MLSTLDLREKSLFKILFCVLSCSSQCPSIWVWWWSIDALAPRRSCSSDFSHREPMLVTSLSRWFYHDGRDPNVSTCQCQRLGMSWQRTIVSVSYWICDVPLKCDVIFLLDHVSVVVLTLLCILLVHNVVIFLSIRRYLTLIASLLEKMTMTDLDSNLVFHGRVLKSPSLSSCDS